jgi:uncharacterized membrane protein
MRFVGLRGASFESWTTGVGLAFAHLLLVGFLLVLAARSSHDAQWQLGFLPLLLVDLPIAVIAYPLGFAAAWAAAWAGIRIEPTLVAVAVANGLVGSLFYLVLPPAISAHRMVRRRVQ